MKRELLEEYAKSFVRSKYGFKFINLIKIVEYDDLILYELVEKSDEYKYPRSVFLIALRSSIKKENGWFMFSPTENHYYNLNFIRDSFKKIWNGNQENKGNEK